MQAAKDNEIAVLKEMIKSSQTQIKQKETELVHMKKKLSYAEGQNLAARQTINAGQQSLIALSKLPDLSPNSYSH